MAFYVHVSSHIMLHYLTIRFLVKQHIIRYFTELNLNSINSFRRTQLLKNKRSYLRVIHRAVRMDSAIDSGAALVR